MADLAELAQGLTPTIQIFWPDSYKTTGESKILRVAPDEKKHYYLVLDETIFYPKGGGQPSDKGIMSGAGFKIQVKKVMQFVAVIVLWGKLVVGTLGNVASSKGTCEIAWVWRFT